MEFIRVSPCKAFFFCFLVLHLGCYNCLHSDAGIYYTKKWWMCLLKQQICNTPFDESSSVCFEYIARSMLFWTSYWWPTIIVFISDFFNLPNISFFVRCLRSKPLKYPCCNFALATFPRLMIWKKIIVYNKLITALQLIVL